MGSEGVGCSSEFLASGPVRARQDLRFEACCLADCVDGQVEDPGQLDLVPVHDAWEDAFQADGLSVAEVVQLGDDAWPGAAQVENREAARRVEPSTVESGTLPAQRLVPWTEVPPALTGEWAEGAAATLAGSSSTPLRRHALGHGQHRADHAAVIAIGDELQRLPPVQARLRAAEPEASVFVP